MWSLVKSWCESTYWQHGVALVLSVVGMAMYPYIALDFFNSPITYACVLTLLHFTRPHVRGSLQKFQPPASTIHLKSTETSESINNPRITLLHSGSGILSPVLYNPSAFVSTSSQSVFLLSQWIYYLNPLLVLFLEMISGIEVSYLRDFNVRTLLAQKRHILVTPGGALENVASSDQCQGLVLTKYPYWHSILKDHDNVNMDCVIVYGALRLLWKQPTFLTSLRTWMGRRDMPTLTILYPRFPSVRRVLYVRTMNFTPCTLVDMCSRLRDHTSTDSAGSNVSIPLSITSRMDTKKPNY
jgi:hypothetical protein